MDINKRQDVERRLVRHLIRAMKKAGWQAFYVNDGGSGVKSTGERQLMEAVFSVDESRIYFRKKIGDNVKKHWVFLVLGNSGWDSISDYSCSMDPADDFEAVMTTEVNPYADKLGREVW